MKSRVSPYPPRTYIAPPRPKRQEILRARMPCVGLRHNAGRLGREAYTLRRRAAYCEEQNAMRLVENGAMNDKVEALSR